MIYANNLPSKIQGARMQPYFGLSFDKKKVVRPSSHICWSIQF